MRVPAGLRGAHQTRVQSTFVVSCSTTARAVILAGTLFREDFQLQFEPRDQFEQRQKKLQQIQALGHDVYPREFRWTDTAAALVEQYGQTPGAELEANRREV